MVEDISTVAGDQQILEPVVVVISYGDAHAVTGLRIPRNARLPGHIAERAIAVLMEQAIPVFFVALVRASAGWHGIEQPSSIREKEVQATVVVVIEKRHAATHRFNQVFLRGR